MRCRNCLITHALIPEFSLPSTSIGTKEANEYLQARRDGTSQKEASVIFTEKGLGSDYGVRFEKRVIRAERIALALLGQEDCKVPGLFSPEIIKVTIIRVNYTFLKLGYNPLFFSRRNILRIREIKLGRAVSLNKGAIWSAIPAIDSG